MRVALGNSVLQIVGYQNSGKTTLIKKIVSFLHGKGTSVGVLKHHGHGGIPKLELDKDNTKHFEAGAIVSMVEGEGTIQLVGELPEMGIERKIALLRQFQVDLVLIEGYKNLTHSKIVIIRRKEDVCLLENLSNIIAIAYWPEVREDVFKHDLGIPKYAIENDSLLELVDIKSKCC